MGFELDQHQSHVESVNEFKERMEDTLTKLPTQIQGVSDTSDIHTTRPSQKLSHRILGPFLVIRKVRNGAYHLHLPPSMSGLC